jgi:mono/diheme cytochrome c family protein
MPRANLPASVALFALAGLVLVGCGGKAGGSDAGSGTSGGATQAAPAPDTTRAAPSAVPAQASVEFGEKVFQQRCVLCHGPEGRGNGPASAALKPPPRNFHDAAYMHSRTDAELLTSVRNGKSAMPPWGKVLSDVEIRSALMYVRTFAGRP